jgi:hypothetical protein
MVSVKWQQFKVPRKLTATHGWFAPHVVIVYEGATFSNGTENPARPWVDVAIDEYDFLGKYADKFSQSQNFKDAFVSMSEGFGEACQSNLEDDRWQWPRPTVRRNGSTVTSPRNIVDMGELKDSYQVQYEGV